jgi:hypothetical protein
MVCSRADSAIIPAGNTAGLASSQKGNVVLKRLILLAVIVFVFALHQPAQARIAAPAISPPAAVLSEVRWVCGPERCYWRPNYAGQIVVFPWMIGWGVPPNPRCFYEKRQGEWRLNCPR